MRLRAKEVYVSSAHIHACTGNRESLWNQLYRHWPWRLSVVITDIRLIEAEAEGMRIHIGCYHDDVIKWKHFPRNWPFVWGIHRSPVNSPHKGQWRGALVFSLICVWMNDWVNNREAGDLRRYRAHYDVIVMITFHVLSIVIYIYTIYSTSVYSLHSLSLRTHIDFTKLVTYMFADLSVIS